MCIVKRLKRFVYKEHYFSINNVVQKIQLNNTTYKKVAKENVFGKKQKFALKIPIFDSSLTAINPEIVI